MDSGVVLSTQHMNRVLREIARAEDPGQPVRDVGVDLQDLTEPWEPKGPKGSDSPSSPYERLTQAAMIAGYASPRSAFKGMMAVMSFMTELLGPHQSILQLIGPRWTQRLLVGLMFALRLQEPDPEAIELQELLLVR